ncbi:MAG TPA: ribokinase [Acidobacteriota bacterium]|nr:ribokinase [Acidobacteriota bacterium]
MRPKVLVIGSSNTDMVVQMPRLPAPGETVLGGDFVVAAGGKGANQAVAAARLGAEVTFVARIGTDMLGDQSLQNFAADGLVTDYIVRDSSKPSGVALIMVGGGGENMIAVASGANGQLGPADVAQAKKAIAEASVMLLQLEIPMPAVLYAVEAASEAGLTVILNPAPARVLDEHLLERITVLTPNATETEILTGILPADEEGASRAADRLLEKGVTTVVITLGKQGAFYAGEKGAGLVPGRSVEAIDTTAAGDAFNGALAVALASGRDLEESVDFANSAAAISVTRVGAQPSLPQLEELGVGS